MSPEGLLTSVDDLLDQAGDAIARNAWQDARRLAEEVLRRAPHHPEADLVLRTANACLGSGRTPWDPFFESRDLRFMSLMFCDVVGSTRLARKLGDVSWRRILEGFRRRCARAVRRYDGHIHGVSGDELLILFGYPRVREDDARRAVLAGLDVVAAVTSFSGLLEQEHGVPLSVRVGVHTGKALITSPTDGSGSAEVARGDGLVGETANIAKRIESAARPNTVWVSDSTRRIVEGFFDFAQPIERGSQVRVDAATTVAAHQVNARTGALNRHQIARVQSDEMVGRRAERGALLALWDTVAEQGAPFVVVSGEAGIGKSRLVEFLAETAAGNRARRLECVCTEMQKPVAFAPLIGVLERFANLRQADEPATRLSKLRAAFGELAPEFAEFVPYLAWMMSIPGPPGQIAELEPEAVRNRIFDCLLKVLRLAASLRPSVFWIEDLQWADRSTQELCRRLAAEGPSPGLLAVATVRTEQGQQAPDLTWVDEERAAGRLIRIELGPLSPTESRHLVETRSGAQCDDAFARAVLDSTGGNPLYIEEVVRARRAPSWAPRHHRPSEAPAIGIPERLQPIFEQTVERLGADRPVAQVASLLGRDLPGHLTRVVVGSILGQDEAVVAASLARLIDAEVIDPVFTDLSPGYRFRHDLIREALMLSVGPDASFTHGRIAEEIERSFPSVARDPALLAYHFSKAERHGKAAEYRLAAGLGLQARAAHEEAIAAFDRGLESLARMADAPDATGRARLELSLCASRAVSIQTTKGYADGRAGDDWTRAYELSRQLGARDVVVPALGGLWSFDFVRGAYDRSLLVARQIIEASESDPEGSLIGNVCLAYSHYYQGQLVAGRESAERGLRLYERVRGAPSHFHLPQDPVLAGLSLLAPVRWTTGDQLGGLRAAHESLAIAGALETKRAINLARVWQFNAWLHQIRGDAQSALTAAEEGLAISLEHHLDWAVVNLQIHKGLALAHLGPTTLDEGAALVRTNLAHWRVAGSECFLSYFLGELAKAYQQAGDHAAALDVVAEAFEIGARVDEHLHDAELLRVRGLARLADGSTRSEGVEDLLQAEATACRQGAVSLQIRAGVSLLSTVSDLPDRAAVVDRLERAVNGLQSSEQGWDEREGKALVANARVR